MKDLSYKHFFDGRISHEDALRDKIKSSLERILMDENEVSEKSFSEVNKIVAKIKSFFTDDIFKIAEKMYNDNKRIDYIAEFLYISKFQYLQ